MEPVETICIACGGTGRLLIERDGDRFVRDCTCRVERRVARMLKLARIPARYANCTLDSYQPFYPDADDSLAHARYVARNFVKQYPLDTNGVGLLLTGQIGTGKTHLAVGILRALIQERGASGLFFEYKELLKQIQHSYDPRVHASEYEILKPIFEAEILVLDELGASKPTDWVFDTVAHILNTRYNDRRTTILTTNYPNAPASLREVVDRRTDPQRAMLAETLGDRVTDRVHSRLQEMCTVVELQGKDYRIEGKQARFG